MMKKQVSADFASRLEPVGRILDLSPDYVVWDCAPVYGHDGKVHVFFTRVPGPQEHWFKNFRIKAEVVHATADSPEGPYSVHDVVLKGRGDGFWDGYGIVNPRIYRVGKQYALFFTAYEIPWPREAMKEHIGLLLSDDLKEWTGANRGQPVLSPDFTTPNAWDSMIVNNAAFVEHNEPPRYRLYYRGARTLDRFDIGLAEAESLSGPYKRLRTRPVIETASLRAVNGGDYRGFEDPCVWHEDGIWKILVKDMGYFPDPGGCYLESEDGISWGSPERGYYSARHYWHEEGPHDSPLLLLDDQGRPDYLFTNRFTNGRGTGFVFKVNPAADVRHNKPDAGDAQERA